MTNSHNQLRINVGFILNKVIGYSRDFHFAFPEILLSPDLALLDYVGMARINRTPQGLLVNSDIHADTILECVRCLQAFRQPLHTVFDELYAFSKRSTTESELILPDDGYIDIQPLAREYLLLEIPISPICRQDCLGLCPVCGTNWNIVSCPHQTLPGRDKNK